MGSGNGRVGIGELESDPSRSSGICKADFVGLEIIPEFVAALALHETNYTIHWE